MATELAHEPDVKRLSEKLDKRAKEYAKINPYYEGNDENVLPPAITQARLTKVYRYLMPVAEAPFAVLPVDAKLDRLELTGIQDANKDNAMKVWDEGWQVCHMDSESKLAHSAALLTGRAYATVWKNPDDTPDIALDDQRQMIVEFAEGSRFNKQMALRRWCEGDTTYAALYTPDGIFKFKGKGEGQNVDSWERYQPSGEDWPVAYPYEVIGGIPVSELRVNGRLAPGSFPYARGEFAHCLGLIDRINLLTFLGLVVAFWMGFPLRGVIGEKLRQRVLVDDEGTPLIDTDTGKPKTRPEPVIEAQPDSMFQLENPDAKLAQFDAADRNNLSIFAELDQLAVITKTPRHYFPMEGGMQNLSAEAIMASEGGMHAAVTGHKASLGDPWVEVNRNVASVLGTTLTPAARMSWADTQSRSLAERADAASKLKDVLPQMVVAEIALDASQDQIRRWQAEAAGAPIAQLIAAANQPQSPPVAAPSGNGAG